MSIVDYKKFSIAVRGTESLLKPIEKDLGKLGKYNIHAEGGPAWIISRKKREEVEKLIAKLGEQKDRDDLEDEEACCAEPPYNSDWGEEGVDWEWNWGEEGVDWEWDWGEEGIDWEWK